MQTLIELSALGLVLDRHLFRVFQPLFQIGQLMFHRPEDQNDVQARLN